MKDFYTLRDLENWDEPKIRLGVIGDPVTHSRSPEMMNPALRACGLEMEYARFEIAAAELASALPLFAAQGFVGLNCTVPHKVAAASMMDELDDFARTIGAVNTMQFEGGRALGCNTDGPGFSRAIREEFLVSLSDLRILILGAGGGAGRAIAQQCANEKCRRLVLANRDFDKARTLADRLNVEALEWNLSSTVLDEIDLVVNATPLGLQPNDSSPILAAAFAPHLMIYDVVYAPGPTRLLESAQAGGARTADGLSMLLHQGALAFERWFQRAAPLAIMQRALRSV